MGVYTVEIEGKASFEARLSRKLYLNSKSRNQLDQMLGKNLMQSQKPNIGSADFLCQGQIVNT